jgi:hypothetical protein
MAHKRLVYQRSVPRNFFRPVLEEVGYNSKLEETEKQNLAIKYRRLQSGSNIYRIYIKVLEG